MEINPEMRNGGQRNLGSWKPVQARRHAGRQAGGRGNGSLPLDPCRSILKSWGKLEAHNVFFLLIVEGRRA